MQANFGVVLDACVLANAALCDLFLRLAEPPRQYIPLWSEAILEEVYRTQTTKLKRPYPPDLADYWRAEVTTHFPDALVAGYETLLPILTNDEKDRHVLAAAIMGRASVIVTFNTRHFPPAALKPWQISAYHPQDYLLTLFSMNPAVVMAKLAAIAQDRRQELEDVVLHLGNCAPAFSARVLEVMGK